MRFSFLIILLVGLVSCFDGHDSIMAPPVAMGSEEPYLEATDYGLVLSWLEPIDGDIHLRYSIYKEPRWSEPKSIARGTNWFVNWADFPAVISNGDKLFAHYLEMSGEHTYDYDIMYTISHDRGDTWSDAIKLHSDSIRGEHGFVSGIPYKDGFAVTWLDGRYTSNENPRMSLRGGIIDSSGLVVEDYELDSMTCDCCQTATVLGAQGPMVFYRDRTVEEVRDIKHVGFSQNGAGSPAILHDDQWQINACPVNGPAVAGLGNDIAVAWYSGKDSQFDIKLKISSDGGINFGEPIYVDGPESFGRMDLQIVNNIIYLTYMTDKDNGAAIMLAKYDFTGKLIAKLPLATVSPDRGTGFPRTAIWNNKLVVAWTDLESARLKLLTVPLTDNSLAANYQQQY